MIHLIPCLSSALPYSSFDFACISMPLFSFALYAFFVSDFVRFSFVLVFDVPLPASHIERNKEKLTTRKANRSKTPKRSPSTKKNDDHEETENMQVL